MRACGNGLSARAAVVFNDAFSRRRANPLWGTNSRRYDNPMCGTSSSQRWATERVAWVFEVMFEVCVKLLRSCVLE